MTHHAIVYKGDSLESIVDTLPVTLSDVDTEVIEESSLSIKAVRRLTSHASQRPVEHAHRTFVIVTSSLSSVTQNALLKLFEDPPAHCRFVLVIPRIDELIPTLRSRVMIMDEPEKVSSPASETIERLRATSIADTLAAINEWNKAKNNTAMVDYLDTVELALENRAKDMQPAVTAYLQTRARFHQPGAAKKMLLEHLALSLRER